LADIAKDNLRYLPTTGIFAGVSAYFLRRGGMDFIGGGRWLLERVRHFRSNGNECCDHCKAMQQLVAQEEKTLEHAEIAYRVAQHNRIARAWEAETGKSAQHHPVVKGKSKSKSLTL
jgi:hypothetical protein